MTSEQNKRNKQTTFLNKYIILSWFGRSQCDKQNKQTTFLNNKLIAICNPRLSFWNAIFGMSNTQAHDTCTWKTKKRPNFNIIQLKLAIWKLIRSMGNKHPSWDSCTENNFACDRNLVIWKTICAMYGQHPSSDRAWCQSSMNMMCYNSRGHSKPINTANPQCKLAHCLIMDCPQVLKQGVCHTVALPFTLKSILRQKKNYGNPDIHHAKI